MSAVEETAVEVAAEPVEKQPEPELPPIARMGDIVIVRGFKVNATGSEEDPAIVNSIAHTFKELKDGQPVGAVNVTLFPEGAAPRAVRMVPLFASREHAIAFDAAVPTATSPDAHLVAFPKD